MTARLPDILIAEIIEGLQSAFEGPQSIAEKRCSTPGANASLREDPIQT